MNGLIGFIDTQRSRRLTLAAAGAVFALAGTAFGQGQQERRFERAVRTADPAERFKVDPALGVGERSQLDFGGFAAFNWLHLNDAQDNSRDLVQPEITLFGRASIDGAHLFFGRARFQYRDFSEGDSFDGRGDVWQSPYLDRYWYEFDLRRATAAYDGKSMTNNFNIRVGRQFVDWGQGLSLSENLYAVRPTIELGRFTIEGLAGVTPADRSVVDWDSSRFNYNDHTERGFFGGRLNYTTTGATDLYVYGLHQADYNTDQFSRFNTPTGPLPADFDYDSTYIGVGVDGSILPNLLYMGEFVYEFGHSMSDPLQGVGGAQSREDISAWAGRAQLTWILPDRHFTRVEGELLFASGDDDRLGSTTNTVAGNRPGTNDTAFNSLGFVNTGLAFAPSLSNLISVRLGASAMPFVDQKGFEQFQIGGDFFVFNKMDSDGPIDVEPTTDDAFLGVEMDFYINYRITSDFALSARYGLFLPGEAIQNLPTGAIQESNSSQPRHFIFLGATLSF